MSKRKSLPKEILVYQCDEVDGEPIYAVAFSVNDISEEFAGEIVGNYTLNNTNVFSLKRQLTKR